VQASEALAKVLLIDDEAPVLEGLTRVLRKKFALVCAVGPEAGLAAIRQNGPFAVVVADMRMPGMDGLSLLGRIREISPSTVRILLTGDAEAAGAGQAIERGDIFRCLGKPCQPAVLIEALREAATLGSTGEF